MLKSKAGSSRNKSLYSWLVWNKFQLLVIVFFTLGNVRFYVNISDILLLRFFVFSSRSFRLPNVLVLAKTFFISFSLYPLLINLSRSLSQLSGNSLLVEQVRSKCKAVVMICFAFKCSDSRRKSTCFPVNQSYSFLVSSLSAIVHKIFETKSSFHVK